LSANCFQINFPSEASNVEIWSTDELLVQNAETIASYLIDVKDAFLCSVGWDDVRLATLADSIRDNLVNYSSISTELNATQQTQDSLVSLRDYIEREVSVADGEITLNQTTADETLQQLTSACNEQGFTDLDACRANYVVIESGEDVVVQLVADVPPATVEAVRLQASATVFPTATQVIALNSVVNDLNTAVLNAIPDGDWQDGAVFTGEILLDMSDYGMGIIRMEVIWRYSSVNGWEIISVQQLGTITPTPDVTATLSPTPEDEILPSPTATESAPDTQPTSVPPPAQPTATAEAEVTEEATLITDDTPEVTVTTTLNATRTSSPTPLPSPTSRRTNTPLPPPTATSVQPTATPLPPPSNTANP